MTISKKISNTSYVGVIPAKVLKYSLTNNYILAQQKDYDIINGFGSTINYYALEIYSDKPKKFSKQEFEDFLKEKNIKNIDWETPR